MDSFRYKVRVIILLVASCWVACVGLASHPGGVLMLLVVSCYRTGANCRHQFCPLDWTQTLPSTWITLNQQMSDTTPLPSLQLVYSLIYTCNCSNYSWVFFRWKNVRSVCSPEKSATTTERTRCCHYLYLWMQCWIKVKGFAGLENRAWNSRKECSRPKPLFLLSLCAWSQAPLLMACVCGKNWA